MIIEIIITDRKIAHNLIASDYQVKNDTRLVHLYSFVSINELNVTVLCNTLANCKSIMETGLIGLSDYQVKNDTRLAHLYLFTS